MEVLVALTVFAIGGLGTLSAFAAAERLRRVGDHAARAGRLGQSLAAQLPAGSRHCDQFHAGLEASEAGDTARWQFQPAAGGLALTIVVSYPAATVQRFDTLSGFVPCR